MAATPLYRALLRRQAELARPFRRKPHMQQQQQQQQSRRSQSSANSPAGNTKGTAPKPKVEDPIPTPNTVAKIPLWQRLGPLTRVAEAYARSQRKRPYLTQLLTSLTIYFFSDISAQRISGKDYDPARTLRSEIIGGVSSIPSYRWFIFLSENFNYSSRLLSLAVKVVVNQCCFTPIFNSYFFGMHALLAGEGPADVWDRIRRTVPISCVNSLKVWPAVTAVNFTFVPMEYRSVFAGVVAVGWQTYLAFLNRKAEDEAQLKTDGSGSGSGSGNDGGAGPLPPPAAAGKMAA